MANNDGVSYSLSSSNIEGVLSELLDVDEIFNAVKASTEYMHSIIIGHFETRQDSWQALKPATIKDRIRRGFGASPILVRTGKLEQSLSVSFESNGDSLIGYVISDDPIAEYQDQGTSTIPARPFADLDESEQEQVLEYLTQEVYKALGIN